MREVHKRLHIDREAIIDCVEGASFEYEGAVAGLGARSGVQEDTMVNVPAGERDV